MKRNRTASRSASLLHAIWLCGLLLGGSPHLSTCLGQSPAPTLRRTATNLMKFDIPFSISDPEDKYIEVQLYLSRNRGQSWQFYGRQSTAANAFPFQSSGDGTYWFSLKTLDRDKRLHPEGPVQAELEVIVDTIEPELDFRVQTDAAGRLVCRWRASDENIDPSTVRLAFRPLLSIDDRENTWIPVAYRAVDEARGGVFEDQYAWWPDSPAREVLVQLQISDRAGNRAVEERQVVVPRMANVSNGAAMVTRGSSPPPTQFDPAMAAAQPTPGSPPSPSESTTSTERYGQVVDALKPSLANGPPSSDSEPTEVRPDIAGDAPSEKVVWDNQRQSSAGLREKSATTWPNQSDQRLTLSGEAPREAAPAVPANPPAKSNAVPDQEGDSAPASTARETPGPLTPLPPLPNYQPPLSKRLDQNEPETTAAESPAFRAAAYQPPPSPTGPSEGEGAARSVVESRDTSPNMNLPRYDSINSRRLRVSYSLDRLTPGDVERVVLWITPDQGRTWSAYGEDPDKQSPFPVELPEAGIYGFRVVFHTTDGLSGRSPAPGDPPDYSVRVDLEHPIARLTAAPYGEGAEAGSLVVQWTAQDELLADRPITLSYSTQAEGPWTTIIAGLPNSGRFPWKVSKEVPERVFLRLEVVDAAGNVTTNKTLDAIDLSGLVPKARILGVESIR